MKDRAHWYLSLAIFAFALLLALPGSAAAVDGAPAAAAAASAPAAENQDFTVIDKADSIIPNANHYKCYRITSDPPFEMRRVFLKDQFWSTWVRVIRPVYLCNPVWKTTEDGVTYAPPQPNAHLVCYEIVEDNPTPTWEVKTYDQFGQLNFKGDAAQLLCLPAAKQVVVPPG